MKIMALLLIAITLPFATQSYDLDKYFKSFEKAAKKKDKKALRELIYPYKIMDEDIQQMLIESILADDENSSGDGAFSISALQALQDSFLDEFEPVSDVLYQEFMNNPDFADILKKVKQKDILVFSHNEARIILIKPKKDWQLLFWENLNNLL